GGIRSATLNLGIAQGLAKLGLLRYFDYLSTVSGGGYIGSWLTANLRESKVFSTQDLPLFLEPRSPAVRHLRQYSRYLAPQTGFLSADSWTIFTIWLRNTLLLQAV